MVKKSFIPVLSCIMCMAMNWSVTAFAEDAIDVENYESIAEWKSEEDEYVYPYSVERGNWNELGSIQEAREKSRIPNELLDLLTTKQLIDMVLDYPLLCELDNYEDLTIGYQNLKQNFSAIDELLSRSNAYEEILKVYAKFDIPQERLVKYPEDDGSQEYVDEINRMVSDVNLQKLIVADGRIYNSINLLELMLLELSQDNDNQLENVLCAMNSKIVEKEFSEYYVTQSTSYVMNNLVEYQYINEENGLQTATAYVDGQTYTFTSPTGGQYTAEYCSSTEPADTSNYAEDLVTGHAVLIASATQAYNCHSFAWLQGINDMYQNLKLGSPTPLISDGTYTFVNSTSAAAGDVMLWGGHSARLIELNRPNPYENYIPEPYIINKLGFGPIVTQFLSFCSFYTTGTGVSYYRR